MKKIDYNPRYNENRDGGDGSGQRRCRPPRQGSRVYSADSLVNRKGETPLHVAARNAACHVATVALLHRNFPSAAARDAENGASFD